MGRLGPSLGFSRRRCAAAYRKFGRASVALVSALHTTNTYMAPETNDKLRGSAREVLGASSRGGAAATSTTGVKGVVKWGAEIQRGFVDRPIDKSKKNGWTARERAVLEVALALRSARNSVSWRMAAAAQSPSTKTTYPPRLQPQGAAALQREPTQAAATRAPHPSPAAARKHARPMHACVNAHTRSTCMNARTASGGMTANTRASGMAARTLASGNDTRMGAHTQHGRTHAHARTAATWARAMHARRREGSSCSKDRTLKRKGQRWYE